MKLRSLCCCGIVLALCLFWPIRSSGAENAPGGPVLAPKLQHLVDEHVMAGAVMLVANKDAVLDLEAVGYSDLAAKKPMQADDLFWIASMSKPVTAAAFLMLVDEGRVSLDDPVSKYIPEFDALKVAQTDGTLVPPSHAITIREILSHTSGMRFLNAKDRNRIDSVPLAQSIQNCLREPLLFDPGTRYQYSNEGIDTVGRIIEIVSGMPYEQFLQQRLFTPLGMTDTTFAPTAAQMQRLAKGYSTAADKSTMVEAQIPFLTYPLDGSNRYPAPGGGLFSTAGDVARFCQMLANGGAFQGKTYLSQQMVHAMTTKQTGSKVKDSYGLGISGGDGSYFGHGGAWKTEMWVDHGLIGVFLVQQTGNWAGGDPSKEFGAEARKAYRAASAAPASTTKPGSMVGSQAPAR